MIQPPRMKSVMSLVGDPPCEDACPHYETCKHKLMACEQYFSYVRYSASHRFSRYDGSEPSAKWYARSFRLEDMEYHYTTDLKTAPNQ